MKFKILLLLLASTFGFAGCSDSDESPAPKAVEEITLDKSSLELKKGETAQLTATVLPADADDPTIAWSSSDEAVATIDQQGQVTAAGVGTAIITAQAGEVSATCTVTVLSDAKVGSYYYADGSVSETLDASKTPIGIVFWVGDPSQDDAALRREHPGCTNGLVVALGEKRTTWQADYGDLECTVGEWVEENLTDYVSVEAGWKPEDNLYKMLGYNNTKAIEAFNDDSDNLWLEVEAVSKVGDYAAETAAPQASSGWYLPSAKELSLLCSGVVEGPFDEIEDNVTNRDLINAKLASIDGATQLSTSSYWSSSEDDERTAYVILFKNGCASTLNKGNNTSFVRCILAF